MKTLFFLIYFLFLAVNSNSQDYNYEFIANGIVANKIQTSGYDTLNVTTRVTKNYNNLIISNNNNIEQTIYNETVSYAGVQIDGDLLYRGKGKKYNSLFFVNPLKKTVKIYQDKKLIAQYGLEIFPNLVPESYK